MKKNTLKIKRYSLLCFLVYCVFIKPGMVEDIEILDILWNIGRFGLSCAFFLKMIIDKRSFRGCRYAVLILVITTISTYLNNGLILIVFGHWVPIIGIIAWIEFNKDRMLEMIKTFFFGGRLFLFCNLITMLGFPNGIWKRDIYITVWLLGQKQDFINCILSTVFFGLLLVSISKKYKASFARTLVYIVVILMMGKPVGLIICLSIILILIIFENRMKRISIKTLGIMNGLAECFCIVISYVYTSTLLIQKLLSSIVIDGMSKMNTMGSRFTLWKGSFEIFMRNILFGIGQPTQQDWYRESGADIYYTIMHNMPLDIAYTGGCITLCAFLAWNIAIIRKLNSLPNSKTVRYIEIVYFAFNIICLTECPYQPMMLIIYAIALNAERLLDLNSICS